MRGSVYFSSAREDSFRALGSSSLISQIVLAFIARTIGLFITVEAFLSPRSKSIHRKMQQPVFQPIHFNEPQPQVFDRRTGKRLSPVKVWFLENEIFVKDSLKRGACVLFVVCLLVLFLWGLSGAGADIDDGIRLAKIGDGAGVNATMSATQKDSLTSLADMFGAGDQSEKALNTTGISYSVGAVVRTMREVVDELT